SHWKGYRMQTGIDYTGPRLLSTDNAHPLIVRLQGLQGDDWSARAFLSVRDRGFHDSPPYRCNDIALMAQVLRLGEEFAEYLHAASVAHHAQMDAGIADGFIAPQSQTATIRATFAVAEALREIADILIVCAQIGWHCG